MRGETVDRLSPRVLVFVLLVLSSLTTVFSTKATKCDEGGCPCGTTSSDKKYEQSEESSAMCLDFAGYIGSDDKSQFHFSTKVDDFTLVSLAGMNLQNDTYWNMSSVTVRFETGGYVSEYRTLMADQSNRAVQYLTLVILVDEGRIDDIVWDDTCIACSDSDCFHGNCGTKFNECPQSGCELNVYVSWYGTDKDGNYLLSSGQRLSQFDGFSAASYYEYAADNRPSIDFDTSDIGV